MHKFMQTRVQLISYLDGGYLIWMVEIPRAQEKSEQIFFVQPKAHQFKFADRNKTVPMDFLRSVKWPTKRLAFLRRLPRTESSQKRRRLLMFLSRVAVNQATSIVATSTASIIKATDTIAKTKDLTIIIKMIDATFILVVTTRTPRTASPMRRRMIASAIT